VENQLLALKCRLVITRNNGKLANSDSTTFWRNPKICEGSGCLVLAVLGLFVEWRADLHSRLLLAWLVVSTSSDLKILMLR
jgi:hypothetical protein